MTCDGRPRLRGLSPELGLIASIVRSAPALPGAACKGLGELFDGRTFDDRAEATRLCGRCPELADCRRWVAKLGSQRRPPGVVAGRFRHHATDRWVAE